MTLAKNERHGSSWASLIAACQALPITRTIPRWGAWTLVLVTWAAGFGLPTVVAVQQLIGGQTKGGVDGIPWRLVTQLTTSTIAITALLVCCAVVVMLWASSGNVFRWRGWRSELQAGGLTQGSFIVCGAVMTVVNALLGRGATAYVPPDSTPANIVVTLSTAGTAGLMEEPLFTVLIPVALRAAGYRWRTVIAVSVVLRVGFHLYYGPGALLLAGWAAVAVLVVARTGCLWGIIIFHGASNLFALGAQMLPGAWSTGFATAYAVMVCVIMGGVGYAVYTISKQLRRLPTEGTGHDELGVT